MSEEETRLEEVVVSCPDNDNEKEFKLSRFAAKRCEIISSHIEMVEENELEAGVLPLPNIDAQLMPKIIDFLEAPYEERDDNQLSDFELEWMPEDTKELAPLILASNYLGCQEMLDALTQQTANLMKGKTPEQLREMFGTPDDIPEEKKKEIHEQNKFLLEK